MDYTKTSDFRTLSKFDSGLGANFQQLVNLGCRNFRLIALAGSEHSRSQSASTGGAVRIQFDSTAQKVTFVEQCLKGLNGSGQGDQIENRCNTDWKWLDRNRPQLAAMQRKPTLKLDCHLAGDCNAEWFLKFEKAIGSAHSFIIVSESRLDRASAAKAGTMLEILVFPGYKPDLMTITALAGLSEEQRDDSAPLDRQRGICRELEGLGVSLIGANSDTLFFLFPSKVGKQEEKRISCLLGELSDELATDYFREWGVKSIIDTTRFLSVSRLH